MTANNRIFRSLMAALGLVLALPAGSVGAEPDNDPPRFQGRNFPFAIIRPVQPAPVTSLHTLKGGVTTLARYSGKVVLLNLWATWCPACLHEMPSLDKLQARLGGDRFTVVTLSLDSRGTKDVLPYLQRLGIKNLPVYLDPVGRTAEALEVAEGLPWTFLIDHRGKVMGYMKGAADWDTPEGHTLIRYYTGRIPR